MHLRQWCLLSSAHVCRSLLSQTLHIHALFFSDSSNICSSRAQPVYFLECEFSPGRWLNSAVSDGTVFGLATGDGGSGWSGSLSAPVTLTVLGLRAAHTAAIHSPSTQDRVRIVQRPAAMPGMLSWSSSLGKKMAFHSPSLFFPASFPLKGFSILRSGSLRALADLFPLYRFQSGQSERPPSQRNPKESCYVPHRYFLTQSHIPVAHSHFQHGKL